MRSIVFALAVTTTGVLLGDAPPVKMGLWEQTAVTTTTVPPGMMDLMKQAGTQSGVPVTMKKLYCVTPDLWEKEFGLKPPTDACVVSNRSVTGSNATMKVTCNAGGVELASEISITFDSTEAWHGSGHSLSTFPPSMMGGGKLTTESTWKADFKSSACGDVKPEHPVTEK